MNFIPKIRRDADVRAQEREIKFGIAIHTYYDVMLFLVVRYGVERIQVNVDHILMFYSILSNYLRRYSEGNNNTINLLNGINILFFFLSLCYCDRCYILQRAR